MGQLGLTKLHPCTLMYFLIRYNSKGLFYIIIHCWEIKLPQVWLLDSTRGRDVPLIFVLRRWCRDSNPGWLSQPLLWRVVLTSCTVRVLANGSAYDNGGGGIVWSLHDAKFLSFICSCIDHYMVQMVLSFIYTDWKCFLDLHAGKGWGGHDGIQKRHTVIRKLVS